LNPRELTSECRKILAEWGSFHFAAGLFSPGRPRDHSIMAVDYPDVWAEHYFREGYLEIDSTITSAGARGSPYSWSFDYDAKSKEGRLFRDIHEIGVRDGYTVPVHRPSGLVFVASFALRQSVVGAREKVMLHWLGALLSQKYTELTQGAVGHIPHLTVRERDIMTWLARGKSSWSVGQILGISEHTVNQHLKNVLAKLQVNGRTLGIVKAIALGIIDP
jgi:LuxR family quorum-sensing system transcriptional regulator CciR